MFQSPTDGPVFLPLSLSLEQPRLSENSFSCELKLIQTNQE